MDALQEYMSCSDSEPDEPATLADVVDQLNRMKQEMIRLQQQVVHLKQKVHHLESTSLSTNTPQIQPGVRRVRRSQRFTGNFLCHIGGLWREVTKDRALSSVRICIIVQITIPNKSTCVVVPVLDVMSSTAKKSILGPSSYMSKKISSQIIHS